MKTEDILEAAQQAAEKIPRDTNCARPALDVTISSGDITVRVTAAISGPQAECWRSLTDTTKAYILAALRQAIEETAGKLVVDSGKPASTVLSVLIDARITVEVVA